MAAVNVPATLRRRAGRDLLSMLLASTHMAHQILHTLCREHYSRIWSAHRHHPTQLFLFLFLVLKKSESSYQVCTGPLSVSQTTIIIHPETNVHAIVFSQVHQQRIIPIFNTYTPVLPHAYMTMCRRLLENINRVYMPQGDIHLWLWISFARNGGRGGGGAGGGGEVTLFFLHVRLR